MALELATTGITVNTLAPGAIETELVRKMHDAETRRVYLQGIPMDRYGTPEEATAAQPVRVLGWGAQMPLPPRQVLPTENRSGARRRAPLGWLPRAAFFHEIS